MVVVAVVVVQCFTKIMSGSRKTFDEYYSDMQYFKNTAESYNIAVNFPNHLDICNALYNAGLEVCIVDSRNWSYPKIGIRGNFLSAISSFRRLNSDVLLRSDMFTCGCYVAAVDQQSVRSGGEGLGSFGDGVWRSATGTGGSPVFSGYTFFKLNIFPCQNCGIPLGVDPGSGFPSHSDRKYGGDFVKAMVYPRSSCVLNPWISNMTNMFRWAYNASGTGASNWVNKSSFQKAPCVDQEWIQWVKDEENENGFTFQSVVVFFSGKFKGTTYPMIEDKNYILDVLSAMREATGQRCELRPYFGEDAKISDMTESDVIANWSDRNLSGEGFLYVPDYEVMAINYKKICIFNFIDLAKNGVGSIKEKDPGQGGIPEQYPTYEDESGCVETAVLTCPCPSPQWSCPSSQTPGSDGGQFATKQGAYNAIVDKLDELVSSSPIDSKNKDTYAGKVVKKNGNLFYKVTHNIYKYNFPDDFNERINDILNQKEQEAKDSITEEEDPETGDKTYKRSYTKGQVLEYCLCAYCADGSSHFSGTACSAGYEQTVSDSREDLEFINIPDFDDFLDEYFPDTIEFSSETIQIQLTTSSSENCAPITNKGNADIYASNN